MALNNVPQSGQTLNDTRNPIRNNFSTINAAFLVDHIEYNLANQGFHNKVTLPAQVPTPLFNGLNGLWSELYATTAKPEIWVNTNEVIPANSRQYPMTASVLRSNPVIGNNTNGWTYLPSGVVMKWGIATINNALPVINLNAIGPAFGATFMGQVCAQNAINTNAWIIQLLPASLTMDCSPTNRPIYWFVIGRE